MRKVSILLAVLMMVVIASPLYALQSAIPGYVDRDNNDTVKVVKVDEFGVVGNEMNGMKITVAYTDGTSDTATWFGGKAEFASGYKLSHIGDTYEFDWLATGSQVAIQTLTIDALAGNVVFDIYDYAQGLEPESEHPVLGHPEIVNTMGSRRGYAFEYAPAYGDDIHAMYSKQIAVGGDDPLGDLYGMLVIDFGQSGITGGFSFMADTDTIVPVPEPGTLLLLGLGVLGLLGYAKKRK